jgi:hypothetical protein
MTKGSRRWWIGLVGCLAALVAGCGSAHHPSPHGMNPIVAENQRRGAEGWFVPYPQWSFHHEVEGYTDQPSYDAGERVRVQVSSMTSPVAWTLYRTGWYGGRGARKVLAGLTEAIPQALPPASTWDVPCEPRWATTFRFDLPSDAVSGVYALRLDAGGFASMITFVVRDDRRVADLVFQRSDFTDAMYNDWDGADNTSSWYGAHPQWVSLDRVQRSPAGWLYPYSGGYFTYEYSMVRFLEREGYDVTYLSNLDVHQDPHALERGRAFLSVGHDEYWSPEMRDQVERARDRGMHLAFFSSDTCDGVIRFRPADPHAISTTKVDTTAEIHEQDEWASKTVDLSAPPHDNPTDTLTGTHYGGWCGEVKSACWDDGFAKLVETDAPLIVDGSHPVWRNLFVGEALPRIIGYEYEMPYDGATPLPFAMRTIANVPEVVGPDGPSVPAVVVAYQAASGARVFNVGSMHWAHGLDGWSGQTVFRHEGGSRPCDPGDDDCFDVARRSVQQVTVNVLADMGAKRGTPSADLIDSGPCDWTQPSADCVPGGARLSPQSSRR